jgi:hypothetical protein
VAAFRCTGWQHNFALGGRITLHWVAELIAFSKFSAGFPASPPIQSIVGNIPFQPIFGGSNRPHAANISRRTRLLLLSQCIETE